MKQDPDTRRVFAYLFLVLLFIFHQDFWLWKNGTLVFGFIPAGLAYHMAFSLLSALAWYLAVRFAWPAELEEGQ